MKLNDDSAVLLCSLVEPMSHKHMLQCVLGHLRSKLQEQLPIPPTEVFPNLISHVSTGKTHIQNEYAVYLTI